MKAALPFQIRLLMNSHLFISLISLISIARISRSSVNAGLPCTNFNASTFFSGLPTTFVARMEGATTIVGITVSVVAPDGDGGR